MKQKRQQTDRGPSGLKAMSAHRRFAAKGYIPRDLDGAYRVTERLDKLSQAEIYKLAEENKS